MVEVMTRERMNHGMSDSNCGTSPSDQSALVLLLIDGDLKGKFISTFIITKYPSKIFYLL